ncbi:hypothetical protein AKJ37_00060 [candidate division MSBL1 archaeon SCGC-AAA259I09]|uniref:Potassium transporter TrkA n=2 Tax=candidate division MSBL1 TaxID=215777 RepID=A0A133UW68_9EURY|nr:hypothetical protein AKJ36_03445 [candidate division MSBL1 archaeon SCGC-AAA259I07]KXA98396.1 hypothetical protein AKJ37_00060 [candidate division MSBL1 archaeon SCGC-AAA259I09]
MGGGQTGYRLANRLAKRNHETAIVEADERRAHELAAELDSLVIHGTATDIDVLKDAGGEKADALVAVTASDEANFMAVKLAKELGIPRVVSRVNEEKLASAFEDLGADAAISLVDAAVTLYEKAITGPGMYGLLTLGGGEVEVVEVSVVEESGAIGETIKDLNLPDLCTVAMVTRKGELIPPRGDTEFEEGDRAVLVGKSEDVMSVARLFRGK